MLTQTKVWVSRSGAQSEVNPGAAHEKQRAGESRNVEDKESCIRAKPGPQPSEYSAPPPTAQGSVHTHGSGCLTEVQLPSLPLISEK